MGLLEDSIGLGKRAFVLIGESGSGKSEIALNWAVALAASGLRVRFFDMDQTKPIFRSRERAAFLERRGIAVEIPRQLLDAPTVPNAVFDKVRESDFVSILDVGGNVNGARVIAQFRDAWEDRAVPFAVVNWFRTFHDTAGALAGAAETIASAAAFRDFTVISNPNFGEPTSIEETIEGHEKTAAALNGTGRRAALLATRPGYVEALSREFPDTEVMGIRRYLRAPWEEQVEEE